RRPSKTWTTPRWTTSKGASRSMRWPPSSMLPLVMSPRSVRSRPEMALRVVDLPAPLAPSSVVMPPSRTSSAPPLSTSTTPSEMTWMLFRISMLGPSPEGACPPPPAPRIWGRLLGRRGLDVLGHDVRVGRVPVGDLLELAALHLPDLDEPAALVVGRGHLERRHQPAEGEVVDLLEAGLDVGAGDLAVRLGLERVADGLDVQRGDEHPAVVEHGGGHLLGSGLALLLVHLPDLVQHRVVAAHPGELHRVVTLGDAEAAGRVDVGLGRAPHERDDLLQRVPHPLELLDGHRGRSSEQVADHEVGAVALGDVEDLGAHLHAGRRDGEHLELEALLGGEVLEHLDRLAPGRIVVEDVRDLLALEVAAELLLDEVHPGRGPGPLS